MQIISAVFAGSEISEGFGKIVIIPNDLPTTQAADPW